MKTYYYGQPSMGMVKALFGLKRRAAWLRWPAVVVMLLAWAVLLPPAWALVKLGEIGHDIAGWCGFDSREW